MKRNWKAVAAGVAVATTLLACGAGTPEQPASKQNPASVVEFEHGEIKALTVNVNGRDVLCVVFVGYNKGGISCDFIVH